MDGLADSARPPLEASLLADLLEEAHDAILVTDQRHRVVFWNRGAEALYGWSRSEALGRVTHDLLQTTFPVPLEAITDELERNGSWEGELVHRGRSGTPIVVESRWVVRRDGPARQVMEINRDVTERKAVEESLRRAREDAERANRAKTEFLSRMGHELRTPLTEILGFGQLLQRRVLETQDQEHAGLIVSAGKHLLDLINDILDLARIEEGKLLMSLEPVRIGDVTGEVVRLLGPLASQRGIAVSNVREGAGRQVMADRHRLRQVLLNLLSTAMKYNGERGTVTISSEVEGEGLVIAVRDTGPGIAPELQPLVFEPFERAGGEQSTAEGTGLGLTLARRLIEAMGGSIGFRSALGQGSTFWVKLPLVSAPGGDLDQDTPGLVGDAGGEAPHQSTVLYVEDNLSNVKLMERLLALRTGIKLIPAMQGSLGVELAREHHPDLILLDLNLPDASGAEILARLRGDATTADIPVVVLSADATRGQVERLLKAGARAYLTKPFDLEEFLKLLDETVGTSAPET